MTKKNNDNHFLNHAFAVYYISFFTFLVAFTPSTLGFFSSCVPHWYQIQSCDVLAGWLWRQCYERKSESSLQCVKCLNPDFCDISKSAYCMYMDTWQSWPTKQKCSMNNHSHIWTNTLSLSCPLPSSLPKSTRTSGRRRQTELDPRYICDNGQTKHLHTGSLKSILYSKVSGYGLLVLSWGNIFKRTSK